MTVFLRLPTYSVGCCIFRLRAEPSNFQTGVLGSVKKVHLSQPLEPDVRLTLPSSCNDLGGDFNITVKFDFRFKVDMCSVFTLEIAML